jgi:TRAP-type C4-dicarboxylate transport system permease small subunit
MEPSTVGSFRSRLLQILRMLERAGEGTCLVAVAVMTTLTLTQVFLRYIFRSPLVWVEEATVFLMIWMTFVGAGVAVRRGSHIAMTLLLEHFPTWLSRPALRVGQLAVLAFLIVVAWQSWLLAMSVGGQRSPALSVPMTWPYLTMPLGAGFMVSQLLATMLDPGPGQGPSAEEVT